MPSKAARQHSIERVETLIDTHRPEVANNKLEGKFLLWATELFLESADNPPSTEELMADITDGKDDLEIDAYHIDGEERIVYLFQSKFRSAPGNVSKKDVADFCDAPSRLCSTYALASNTNEKIVELGSTFRQKIHDGYELQLVMVTTLALPPAMAEAASEWSDQPLVLNIAGAEVNAAHSLTICDVDDLLTRYDSPLEMTSIDVDLQLQPDQWHESSFGGFRCLVATIAGDRLAKIFDKHRYAMFRHNPRGPLGSVSVNKDIGRTLDDPHERGMFMLLNNGLSGLCESFTYPSNNGGVVTTTVRDFQIVNGCQTTYSIWNHWRRNKSLAGVSVSLKLVEGSLHSLQRRISRASNSQTPMKDWDFLFDDETQIRLQREFAQMSPPIFYELKRGEYKYITKSGPIGRAEDSSSSDIAQTAYAGSLDFLERLKTSFVTSQDLREQDLALFRRVFFTDVTTQYLYLPWLVYQRVFEHHQNICGSNHQNGDYREHGRFATSAGLLVVRLQFN